MKRTYFTPRLETCHTRSPFIRAACRTWQRESKLLTAFLGRVSDDTSLPASTFLQGLADLFVSHGKGKTVEDAHMAQVNGKSNNDIQVG
jgi:hypothetical protein